MKDTVFLFPGDGIHQKDMLNNLYNCDNYFKSFFDNNLKEVSGCYHIDIMDESECDAVISQMRIVFSEIAIASFWKQKGIIPSAVIGHSLGEYAAACFSGVFGLRSCMELIAERGSVLKNTEGKYKMGAVHSDKKTVLSLIEENGYDIEISAVNGNMAVTVSGIRADVLKLIEKCSQRGINANLATVDGGGHNSVLRKYTNEFSNYLSGKKFSRPVIKFVSTVDSPHKKYSVYDGEYWLEQLICPVNLLDAFNTETIKNADCMLDVGVSPVMLGMSIDHFRNTDKIFIPSIRAGRNYKKQLANAVESVFQKELIPV